MSRTLEVAGWVLAIGAVAAAALSRYRMANLADAVARACHELRGPLTAMRLSLTLAERGQLVDLRLNAIELELGRAALALEDLTNAWQRSAPIGRPEEWVDVAQLLSDSVEASRAFAAAHGVEVRLLVECRDRPVVRGERLRLAQAIGNLIANAVEHGGGVVYVSCRVAAAKVVIEVRDEGPGLPAPIALLTLRRTAPSKRRAPGRRGHGLTVAMSVAAAHGGRLVAAPSHRGARLLLELPRPHEAPQLRAVAGAARIPG